MVFTLFTPCLSHFYPNSSAILIWFPEFPLYSQYLHPDFLHSRHSHNDSPLFHPNSHILNLVPCIPTTICSIFVNPFSDFPFWRLQMATENDILTSLTLSISWRNSHRSGLQRKQFLRTAVLQIIKLNRFSISSKNVQEGVQP